MACYFFLVALIGRDGITVRDIHIPEVPKWARITLGIMGPLLSLPFFLTVYSGQTGTESNGNRLSNPGDLAGLVPIYSDSDPYTTDDNIELTALAAYSKHDSPKVGDRILVAYSLENTAGQPLTLNCTFVGARNAAWENKDFGEENCSKMLQPGERLKSRLPLSLTVKAFGVSGLVTAWERSIALTNGVSSRCLSKNRRSGGAIGLYICRRSRVLVRLPSSRPSRTVSPRRHSCQKSVLWC